MTKLGERCHSMITLINQIPDLNIWREQPYHTTTSNLQQKSCFQNQLIVILDYAEQVEDTIHMKKNLLQQQFMIGGVEITNQLDIAVLSLGQS